MKRLARFAVVVLAGCPPNRGGGGGAVEPPGPGVGCPSADGIYIASYMTSAEPGNGHTGWVLPLADLKVASTPNQPEYAQVDAATAGALGIPAPPASLWLMAPKQAPCKATIGSYYAALVESTVPNMTYGIELGG